jgi:hypothetical protein
MSATAYIWLSSIAGYLILEGEYERNSGEFG